LSGSDFELQANLAELAWLFLKAQICNFTRKDVSMSLKLFAICRFILGLGIILPLELCQHYKYKTRYYAFVY
jgi:hypothetical protein